MNILARGEKIQTDELKQLFSLVEDVQLTCIQDTDLPSINLKEFDVIFDLSFDSQENQLTYYSGLKGKAVFVGAVKKQLAMAAHQHNKSIECCLVGMNTLPTFINRSLVELSLLHLADETIVAQIMKRLNLNYRLVGDRVGMVTPRIVCMIINEACYTLQEGTADMKDIDTSMKLGTNYPQGPFEWADKIGITNVYQTLEAIYNDTKDERYKICPLLKTYYLKQNSFYA